MTGIRRGLAPVLLATAALTCAFALQRSLACPIYVSPQPLRTLYKLSERVVVARVGAKEVLKTAESVASVRVALHVTENVKGPPVQLVHLYHTEFVEDDAEQDEEVGLRVSAFSGRPVPQLKQGERYLFFLDRRKEGDGYEVDDESYGIKQLSSDDLKVYLERLKELADLTSRQPEEKHALVEWLVRCAEQNATRWEGAYELLQSAQAAARSSAAGAKEQGEADAAQAQAVAEAPPASGGGEAQPAPEMQASADSAAAPAPDSGTAMRIVKLPRLSDTRYTEPDPALAPLLNAVQKQRLSDALVASSEPSEGDDLLMQVVKDFGDPRLPGFLLARLHRFEDEAPYGAELWLSTLAASLKHKPLIELAASYTQDAAYYEWEEEPANETPVDSAAASTSTEEVSDEEADEPPVDPEVQAAREAAAAERATLKRSATLKAILARVDLYVATGQLAEARP